ncbi:MAG: hypothetical protein HYX68_24455 [Planctomycetes bacterium]|nr:hypothetical protein [Planctomycetota bacterium]
MAIYTPRGLKIRLPLNFAFALMARLYPRVSPFSVLKTTEGIELLPSLFTFVAAVTACAFKLDPLVCGGIILGAGVVGTLITLNGFFAIPGLVELSTLFSYLHGFGLYLGAMAIVAYFTVGVWGVVAVLAALFASFVVGQVLEFRSSKSTFDAAGIALTAAERNFINAYRLHATALGVTTDVTATDAELSESNWASVLEDLARNWPEVVRRFTPD